MRKIGTVCLLVMLAASCARHGMADGAGPSGAGGVASPAAASTGARHARGVPAPHVDHHLHLFSPAGAELSTPPLLPEITLPEELAHFVAERQRRWNDQSALAELYTEDALYFRGGTVGWVRGRSTVAGHVRWSITDTPYSIRPVLYTLRGATAMITGYFAEPDGTEPFGHFHFSLVRDASGGWRSAAESYLYFAPSFASPKTAEQLVAELDSAGIRRGVVLSNAYHFDAVRPEPVPDEYRKVREENDWTAEQVARFPDRLIAFCSFNPLRHYALAELERCAASNAFRGVKLHFNAAQLDFQSPAQVAAVRRVMETANRHRLAMIIHVRSKPWYGREDAEVFLRELIPAAPDVPIQVAHLWGGESFSSSALQAYASAVAAAEPATGKLSFDISGAWQYGKPEEMEEIVRLIRQLGVDRILYGSDASPPEAWQAFLSTLPLTEEEFRVIAGNVAPYMRAP